MEEKAVPVSPIVTLVLPLLAFGTGAVRAQSGRMAGHGGRMGEHDRRFIEMMVPHHQDAIEMAQKAVQFAKHPELLPFAQKIIDVQTAENQQMRTLYRQWYGRELPGTTPQPYTWESDEAFLQEMITHHQMGVHMARMEVRMGRRAPLRELARGMVSGQTAEIAQMSEWLKEWYPQTSDYTRQAHPCR